MQSLQCPYCQSSFLEECPFGPSGGISESRLNPRQVGVGLNDEQALRLNQAATLLQMLEAQLRHELETLQAAFAENEKKCPPLTQSMRDSLKNIVLNVDMICNQPSCPICNEEFILGETVIKIPCSHIYHEACIMPWLEHKHNCPICRFELTDTIPSIEDLKELSETDLLARLATFDIIIEEGCKEW